MEIITLKYKIETGLNPYRFNLLGKRKGFTDAYVNWLEKQLIIGGINIVLPEANKKDSYANLVRRIFRWTMTPNYKGDIRLMMFIESNLKEIENMKAIKENL